METKYIFLDVDGTLINEENIRLVIKKSKRMFFLFHFAFPSIHSTIDFGNMMPCFI